MAESLPSPRVAVKALAAEIARRIQKGEKPTTIRAELLAGGLAPELVDPILAQCMPLAASHWRSTVAAIVSAVIIFVCGGAGLAGGVWCAVLLWGEGWPGLFVIVYPVIAAFVLLSCVAGAVVVGIGIASLLGQWSVSEPEPDAGSEQAG
jgi:hypothetical protein